MNRYDWLLFGLGLLLLTVICVTFARADVATVTRVMPFKTWVSIYRVCHNVRIAERPIVNADIDQPQAGPGKTMTFTISGSAEDLQCVDRELAKRITPKEAR